ncbi:MAG TPA: SDR family oxidoreductase [Methyloceanibacter sp.]|nr:SDR family oxidoreductase [Methyloceanibacter sp.]
MAYPQLLEKDFAKAQPIPRAGKLEDVAQAAASLARDASAFVSGRDLAVDGGLLVGFPLPMVLSNMQLVVTKVIEAAAAG